MDIDILKVCQLLICNFIPNLKNNYEFFYTILNLRETIESKCFTNFSKSDFFSEIFQKFLVRGETFYIQLFHANTKNAPILVCLKKKSPTNHPQITLKSPLKSPFKILLLLYILILGDFICNINYYTSIYDYIYILYPMCESIVFFSKSHPEIKKYKLFILLSVCYVKKSRVTCG